MRDKLLNLMKSEGLTSSRFAEMLEVQPSGISHILSGRNKPGFDLLQKILKRFPKINPDWLLLDSEQMYRDNSVPSSDPQQSSATLFSRAAENSNNHQRNDSKTTAPTDSSDTELSTSINSTVQQSAASTVARIIVLYTDHSFESFTPKK
ncbi:MAG: helix-turn-helix transcriptional regulator [Alistipes sp.]